MRRVTSRRNLRTCKLGSAAVSLSYLLRTAHKETSDWLAIASQLQLAL